MLKKIASVVQRGIARHPNFDPYNFPLHLFRGVYFSQRIRGNLQRTLQVLSDYASSLSPSLSAVSYF